MPSSLDRANISVVAYYPDTRVAEANPAACSTFGLSWEQMMGRRVGDPVWSFVREDGTPLPPDEHPVSRALATHGPVRDVVLGADRAGTGERVWLLANAFCDPEGDDVKRVTVTFVDITGIRGSAGGPQTAEAPGKSGEDLSVVIEGALDGAYIQRAGRYQYVNPALVEMLGASRAEDLVGGQVAERIAPEYRRAMGECARAMAGDSKRASRLNLEYLRLDGSRVAAEASVVALGGAGGDSQLVFVRDRAERKLAEEYQAAVRQQALEAQRTESVRQLASGIAHEFNNILMVQKGYCEMMRSSLGEGDPHANGLAQIEGYADQAIELTRRLLDLGRKQTFNPTDVDLNRLVEDAGPMLQTLVGEAVRLETEYAQHPAIATVDRAQIEQILVSLAAHGRDAMPNGGALSIKIEWVDIKEESSVGGSRLDPGGYVMLSVGDTGSGMDEEAKRRVFEVVQQSDGHVLVESEPERGTTFRLLFPRVETILPRETSVESSPEREQPRLVLVVEDEEVLRGIVVMMVEKLGYQAMEAGNGPEALALVENQDLRPDVLLTDFVMPEMNGRELAERLRGMFSGLKVIYMSGYASGNTVEVGVDDPNVRFLQKPFSTADLGSHLHVILERSGK